MNIIKEIGKLVHDDSSAHFINADMAYVVLHHPNLLPLLIKGELKYYLKQKGPIMFWDPFIKVDCLSQVCVQRYPNFLN